MQRQINTYFLQVMAIQAPEAPAPYDEDDQYDEDDEAIEQYAEPTVLNPNGGGDADQNPVAVAEPVAEVAEDTSPPDDGALKQPQQRPGFGAPVHRPSFGRRRFANERS